MQERGAFQTRYTFPGDGEMEEGKKEGGVRDTGAWNCLTRKMGGR